MTHPFDDDYEYDNIYNDDDDVDFWYWAGYLTEKELEEELAEMERDYRIRELADQYYPHGEPPESN